MDDLQKSVVGGITTLACSFLLPIHALAESPPTLSPEAVQQIDAAAEDWRAKSKAPALRLLLSWTTS